MKISLNWIKKYSDVNLSTEELLERIGNRLAEVEGVVDLAPRYEGIVVAQIKRAADHPDADKLGVYQVDFGKETTQVVAGDKTLKEGDKVAYIAPGVTVPATFDDKEPFVIKKVELRGQDSNGMLGSAKELEFGSDHKGVLVLDTDSPVGTSLIEAYELDDQIVEVENKTLTHRPDSFGIIGFAREIAGIQDITFKTPDWFVDTTTLAPQASSLPLSVVNEVPEGCPRYMAVAMSGVEIKPSPIIMQSYLSRLGVKPISNVVDVTNYILLMTGQPLHAFDYDTIPDGKIIVRNPESGEKLALLDGREIEPHKKAVLICDESRPIAVGGAMGGTDTEVSPETKNIIIECANFDLYSIRETSMKHGLFTDAVTRYARGQSPDQCGPVLNQAVSMMEELSGAKVASPVVDDYETPQKAVGIVAEAAQINNLLGTSYSVKEMAKTLSNIELDVQVNNQKLDIAVPFWRGDLHITEDIAEEVGRLNGFNNIAVTLPPRTLAAVDIDELESLKQRVRLVLARGGANELLNYSGVSSRLMGKVGLSTDNLYRIRNSLSPELEYMRASLLPSLMEKVYPNHRRGFGDLAVFEIGKTHNKTAVGKDDLPVEFEQLGFVFSADDKTAKAKYQGSSYYQAKYYLIYLLNQLGVTAEFKPGESTEFEDPLFTDNRQIAVFVGGKKLGLLGQFTPKARAGLKLPKFSAGFQIDLQVLLAALPDEAHYQRLAKFPHTEHDITFVSPSNVTFAELKTSLGKNLAGDDWLTTVRPLDIFRKEGENQERNITYRVRLTNTKATVTTAQVNELIDKAVKNTEEKFGVKRI